MTQPTILVTGATGNTGGAVVSELLQRGVSVRAMVHTRDPRSAALQARGAEVVIADIFDPDQLVAAMRGVQRAYYVPPYDPYVIQSAVTFAVAAREAKLEAIELAGFRTLAWQDDTEAAKGWIAQLRASGPPPSPNLGVVMGPDFAQLSANLGRSLMEGRLGILTAMFDAVSTNT